MDIERVAHLARIELTPDEIEEYGSQLEQVLQHIEKLNSLDIEGIEPMAHAAPVYDVYREDEEQPDFLLSREEALENAPATAHEQFKMPKVIE